MIREIELIKKNIESVTKQLTIPAEVLGHIRMGMLQRRLKRLEKELEHTKGLASRRYLVR